VSKNLILLILAVLLTLSNILFAVSMAITNYVLLKPYVVGIVTQEVKVENIVFKDYNATTLRYSAVNVTVKNYSTTPVSNVVVRVYLYDSANSIVCNTMATIPSLAAGASAWVEMTLSWTAGKNMTNVTSGSVTVGP
jgi:hypothetical protein